MENFINEMARKSLVSQNDPDYISDERNRFEIIGICYVPMQKWEQVYDEDTAFSAGTLFPALNLPFLGGGR